MRICLFYHSLISDWNHGNAHFLRGIATELIARGHDVKVYEPRSAWSVQNLIAEYGEAPIRAFEEAYPNLHSVRYDDTLDLDAALDDADLVIVHEWNSPDLVRKIGRHHRRGGKYVLLFHDTHHRAVTDPAGISAYDLSSYDGVLAYGAVLRDLYLKRKWAAQAWTWHEAADVRWFKPVASSETQGDLIWIGNWGDDERGNELREYLLDPVDALHLKACIYGVRYPDAARAAIAARGIRYGGWLPNYRVPNAFAQHRVTVHIPRRPYVRALPGIPTIRVFEALACGIPLVSAPWNDVEGLFTPGDDYLTAHTGDKMQSQLSAILNDPALAAHLREHGLRTIQARHTCGHRVDELLAIYHSLTVGTQNVEKTA
jgi:spore maturation protein CgeB